MSLKIRLSRGGAKKRPFYRIVVADSRMPRDGRFIETLGTFDPLKAKDAADRLVLDAEKAKAWIAKGAQPTDRVARLLDGARRRHARSAEQPGEGASRRRRRKSAPLPPPPRPKRPLLPPLAAAKSAMTVPPAERRTSSLSAAFGAAHGVRGELRLQSFTQDPQPIATYGPLSGGKRDHSFSDHVRCAR